MNKLASLENVVKKHVSSTETVLLKGSPTGWLCKIDVGFNYIKVILKYLRCFNLNEKFHYTEAFADQGHV